MTSLRTWAGVLIVLHCSMALAFGPRTHEEVTRAAARGKLREMSLSCPSESDLAAFVADLKRVLVEAAGDRRGELLAIWPDGSSQGLRDLLDMTLDPAKRIHGVDVVVCEKDPLALLALEANSPDLDGRNTDRVAIGRDGRPLAGARGPIPADPAVLDMGGMYGLASQAHAHYALTTQPTANPMALFRDPEHFAVATAVEGGPLTFAPSMARAHFLVALLALGLDSPGADAIALGWLGGAIHYLQDAMTPLHTVQVGAPCVVFHGAKTFLWRALATQGGLLSTLKSPVATVTDVVSNLHLWTEALWDASDIGACIGPDLETGPLGLDEVLDFLSSTSARHLGPLTYATACKAATPEVVDAQVVLEDGAIAGERHIADPEAAMGLLKIGCDATLAASRATALVVASFVSLAEWAKTPEGRAAIAGRLVRERLDAVAARQARLAAWMEGHRDGVPLWAGEVRSPIVIALELLVIAACFLLFRRFRRRGGRAG